MSSSIHQPIALVTGASRGIGKAIACALAKDGFDLILTCHSSMDLLQNTAREITDNTGRTVTPVCCDMGNPDDVRSLFATIKRLDLLVNNAGIAHIGLLQDMTDAQWRRILDTNLSSCFYTARAAIPLFLATEPIDNYDNAVASSCDAAGNDTDFTSSCNTTCPRVAGRIINISSVWGNVGASCEVAYSATKGGINAMTKALAKELAPSAIPVNAIACGCVDTEMNGHLSPEEKEELEDEIPAGRFVTPDEVAAALVQLVHTPAYLTGQIITMDGGWI